MQILFIFFIGTILFSFYPNSQTSKRTTRCAVIKVKTLPKNKTEQTNYGIGSEDPFRISSLIPHWE